MLCEGVTMSSENKKMANEENAISKAAEAEEKIDIPEKNYTRKKGNTKRDTWLKKNFVILTLVLLLVFILCLVIAMFLSVLLSDDGSICNKQECKSTSFELLKNLNETVRPCDDFFEFACGNFMKESSQRTSVIETHIKKVESQLNSIILESIKLEDPPSLIHQKRFFNDCLNISAIEKDRDETFLNMLHEIGGWPIINGKTWSDDNFEWTKAIIKCAKIGLNFEMFLKFDINEDFEDTQRNQLCIRIPKDIRAIEIDILTLTIDLMKNVSVFMGAPKDSAVFEITRTISFQNELAKIVENANSYTYHLEKWVISDVQKQIPGINWLDFINNVTDMDYVEEDYIYVESMNYLKDVYQLLLRTPRRFQADYIIWNLIQEYYPYLSKFIREQHEHYYKIVLHERKQMDRTEFCLQESKLRFPGVADAVYVRKNVDLKTRSDLRDLVINIKYKFANRLRQADWMDQEIKDQGLVNVTELLEYIGGPNHIYNEENYEQLLGHFNTRTATTGNAIRRILEIERQRNNMKFLKILEPVERNDKPYNVIEDMKIFFTEDIKTKVIPAGLIQEIFYNSKRPNYLNIAALGFLISHKLSHSFSIKVNNYIKSSGRYNWWTNSTLDDDRNNCNSNLDQKYIYNVTTSNSSVRVIENFADYAAIDVIYEVYQQWMKYNKHEKMLPKITYTPNETFWIMSAQIYCHNNEDYIDQLHVHDLLGVNEIIKNSRYFANVFKCSFSTNMNPPQKCQII